MLAHSLHTIASRRLCLQGAKKMNRIDPNPLYERGFRGYSMIKDDGINNTVAYKDVGKLARVLFSKLVPLKEGPFGGHGQPAALVLSEIKMEIREGPLDYAEYATIDEFVSAIEALPDPEVPAPDNMGEDNVEMFMQAISALYTDRDNMMGLIKKLQEQT